MAGVRGLKKVSAMNINLLIEQLVFEGVSLPPSHRPQVQAAVEAELGSLMVEGELASHLQAGGTVPHVRAGEIQLNSGGNPQLLGHQVALSVYRGIGVIGEA